MNPLHLPHQADAVTLLEIFSGKEEVRLVFAHAGQCFICRGDGSDQPGPDRHGHAKAGQGQPIPHAHHDGGPFEQVLGLLETTVAMALVQVEIHGVGRTFLWRVSTALHHDADLVENSH